MHRARRREPISTPRDGSRGRKSPCIFPATAAAFSTSCSDGKQHEPVQTVSPWHRANCARTLANPACARTQRAQPTRFAWRSARGNSRFDQSPCKLQSRQGADQDGSRQVRIDARRRHRDTEHRALDVPKGNLMRSIAFLTQKGGTGKTTLAASLAEAAASTGETVIALDLDPQGSLCRWGKRREAAKATNMVIVEPLEPERLPRLKSILEGLADAGFTLAIFDTARAESATIRPVTEAVDLCLLPARPTRFDIEA